MFTYKARCVCRCVGRKEKTMITVEDAQRMKRAGYALELNDGKTGNFVKEQADADSGTDQG